MSSEFTYFAFISYSSKDERVAKWFHHHLEYYHIPSALSKDYPALPKKIRPVFWYKKDLADNKLMHALHEALSVSKYLIVLCSKSSAESEWVNDEVDTFIKQGKINNIIPILIDDTDNVEDVIPVSLRNLPMKQELRCIDFKQGKDHALVETVATMFNVRFDELWQRHKRRHIKILTTFISIVLCFVALFVSAYLYLRPVTEYYSDFVVRNGMPVGIIKMDKKKLKYRDFTYKFEYKRISLSSERKLKTITRLDRFENPVVLSNWVQVDVEGLFSNILPIIDINYTEDLKLKSITFSDEYNSPQKEYIFTLQKKGKNNLLIADVKDFSQNVDVKIANIAERAERLNINRYCYLLDTYGYIIGISYHANNGVLNKSLTNNFFGIPKYTFELDSLHRIKSATALSRDNSLMNDSIGICKHTYMYNDKGCLLERGVFDKNLNPTYDNHNCHKIILEYDDSQRIIQETNYDIQGNLCNNAYGWALTRRNYIDNKNFSLTCYDSNKNRVLNIEGVSKVLYELNDEGKISSKKFYDENDNPCLNKQGYSIELTEYDGNTIVKSFFGTKNQPVIEKSSGCSKIISETNGKGKILCFEAYGIKGERINCKDGFSIMKVHYGENGAETKREYFDQNQKRTISKDGFSIMNTDFYIDDNGYLCKEMSFFGTKCEKIMVPQKYFHMSLLKYDDSGNLIETSTYNTHGDLCYNENGVASTKCTYNNKGQKILCKYYGTDNQLIKSFSFGYAVDSTVYITDNKFITYYKDENGNLCNNFNDFMIAETETKGDTVIKTYYDENHNMVNNPTNNFARTVTVYNKQKKVLSITCYDNHLSRCMSTASFSRVSYEYDGRGNVVECKNYDANDNFIKNNLGVALLRFKYDKRDNIIETINYDDNLRPCTDINGVHKIVTQYYEDDCIKSKTYYDIDNNKCLNYDNFCTEICKYDSKKNVVETSIYDIYGNPCVNKNSVHKIINKFDEKNNCIEVATYDQAGNPVVVNGACTIKYTYKNQKVVKQQFYNTQGLLGNRIYSFYATGNENYVTNYNSNGILLNKGYPALMYMKDINNPNRTNFDTYLILEIFNWSILKPLDYYTQYVSKNLLKDVDAVIMDTDFNITKIKLDITKDSLIIKDYVEESNYFNVREKYKEWCEENYE